MASSAVHSAGTIEKFCGPGDDQPIPQRPANNPTINGTLPSIHSHAADFRVRLRYTRGQREIAAGKPLHPYPDKRCKLGTSHGGCVCTAALPDVGQEALILEQQSTHALVYDANHRRLLPDL